MLICSVNKSLPRPSLELIKNALHSWRIGPINSIDSDTFQRNLVTAIYQNGYNDCYQKVKNEWPLGIRDRSPTERDAYHGLVQELQGGMWYLSQWTEVKHPAIWMHCPGWNPRSDEDVVNEAIELMDKNPALLSEGSVKKVQEALEIAKRSLKK